MLPNMSRIHQDFDVQTRLHISEQLQQINMRQLNGLRQRIYREQLVQPPTSYSQAVIAMYSLKEREVVHTVHQEREHHSELLNLLHKQNREHEAGNASFPDRESEAPKKQTASFAVQIPFEAALLDDSISYDFEHATDVQETLGAANLCR